MAKSLNEIAYRHINKKLMASKLVAGQKLSEQQLAAECGISRTPVREAIRRLTEEGVLYQVPSSGTYVAHLDRRQLINAYEVRMAIEGFALDHAFKNLTMETRLELRRLCQTMHDTITKFRAKKQKILEGVPLVAFLSADLSFHLMLMKAAGNRLAIQIVTNAYQRNQFFGNHSHHRDLRHLSWVWLHHAKIERAIRRGDLEGARRWMRAHIARSMADALAAFDHAAAEGAEGTQRDPVDDALAQLTSRFA